MSQNTRSVAQAAPDAGGRIRYQTIGISRYFTLFWYAT